MARHLTALSIKNYRGIGADTQYLRELKRINLFCGANNSGKSTVLKLVHTAFPLKMSSNNTVPKNKLSDLDVHQGSTGQSILGVGLSIDQTYENLVNNPPGRASLAGHEEKIREFLKALADEYGLLWWSINLSQAAPATLQTPSLESLHPKFNGHVWNAVQTTLSHYSGGQIDQMVAHSANGVASAFSIDSASTYLIPAIRELRDDRGSFDLGEMSGQGLITRLSELQNPNLENLEDRKKFQSINSFLQSVTGEYDAQIEIPSSKEYVLVHMNDRVLPLASLGTGIHEVVMIASYCTMIEDSIICIEEPEIHLHPLMQRKLIQHLNDSTTNQYMIATHSASFIDTPGASVHRVRLVEGNTQLSEAILDKDRFEICSDLGYRASDLVQTNAIIWVEGPSDRIYLKHWIRAIDDDLKEGIHYSIMFYGGRLLSHLSAENDDVSDFIKLRSLNRHAALVMDSDKSSARGRINATKQRLKGEFSKHGGVAWVTKGREIENYIDANRLHEILEDVYSSSYVKRCNVGVYDNALHFRKKVKGSDKVTKTELFKSADKVRVAKAVVENEADLSILDLRQNVKAIVDLIRAANA